ncbi:MAG: M48 family metalloprotease [Coriobacteriia bacterium]
MDLPAGVRKDRIEPLWRRVERNRVRLAVLIGFLSACLAAAAAVVLAAAASVLVLFTRDVRWIVWMWTHLPLVMAEGAALAAFGGVLRAWAVLRRSDRTLLRRLGASRSPTGSCLPTKGALKDMSLAAGFEHSPPLYLLPEDSVNAFAVGTSHKRAAVGVTRGFLRELSVDDQRAVFANLMARFVAGDILWASALSVLMSPVWALRERDLRRDDREIIESVESVRSRRRETVEKAQEASTADTFAILFYTPVIVVTELLTAGHRHSAQATAETADGEAMLLLKDPRAMLRGLERVLVADNFVVSAGDAYSLLFFCWAGFGFAPEDDPEMRRISRLREVVGTEGLVEEILPDISEYLAPSPPRLEQRP